MIESNNSIRPMDGASGPWIIDPHGRRDARLCEAWFHRWGLFGAERVVEFPHTGVAILLSDDVSELQQAARIWVMQDERRRVVIEPRTDEGSTSIAWPRLALTQKVTKPFLQPKCVEDIDEEYLSEVVEIAWTGLEVRLATGGALSSTMIAYLLLAAGMLAKKSANPDDAVARAERFMTVMSPEQRSDPFVAVARRWMHGDLPATAGKGMARYLLDQLCGRKSIPAPIPEDPATQLIYHAHLAAVGDETAWQFVVTHLDLQRGLFRRSSDQPPGQWQFHPVLLCALAARLSQYVRRTPRVKFYPRDPNGRGSAASRYRFYHSGRTLRLGAALLTDAGRRLDPPELKYPHNFGEWGDLAEDEVTLLRALADRLPESPFSRAADRWEPGVSSATLCLRHDVDRPLTSEQLKWHLNLEEGLGCRSSWYFKAETFDKKLAAEIRRRGHEVAYHAELCSSGDDGFFDRLADWLGDAPGLTHHGGLGSEFWRGRASLREAARLGAYYGELPVGIHPQPALWPIDDDLAESGNGKQYLPVTPLPCKFDVFPETIQQHADNILGRGGLLIVEQHPDIMLSEYRLFIRRLAGRYDRRTTVRGGIDEFLALSPLYAPLRVRRSA